ncbi:protein NBR1 [Tanacetum coccineum]
MAASSLVKYGETLRRFNAAVVDNKLSLDLVMLQNKIRSLFTFDSYVKFTMTYVDEDGDAVTLATDDDIHDIVKQSLKPLRITVKLLVLNTSVTYRTHVLSPYQPAYQRPKLPGWPVENLEKMVHSNTD